eukprot:CAMPEP_0183588298 /NCGR_PEP_ID=MMETSP0371-20130417/160549_1 /TAXON_ID=268820 /ORGANISM="Peridinium aciculiferum, Strain PAER-2" /LENGTH=81 /DNA_ID=CAMNT_0025799553 /DNA_START=71 /DNA_END=312 /DNA_ORIENTATION=-
MEANDPITAQRTSRSSSPRTFLRAAIAFESPSQARRPAASAAAQRTSSSSSLNNSSTPARDASWPRLATPTIAFTAAMRTP